MLSCDCKTLDISGIYGEMNNDSNTEILAESPITDPPRILEFNKIIQLLSSKFNRHVHTFPLQIL